MTSHGQRFRRRALRRGYKVDEVDEFLDRVEATLGGEHLDAPVSAQEVHDVVFRVRFGGYDEWQVDLHLDRVERQLSEVAPGFGRAPELPDRMGPPDRMAPPVGAGHGPGPGPGIGAGPGGQYPGGQYPGGPHPGGPRPGPPPGFGGLGPGQPVQHLPAPVRPAAAPAPGPAGYREPPDPGYGPYDEPTYGGYDGHPVGRRGPERPEPMSDLTSEMRFGEPGGGPAPGPGPASYPPPAPPPPLSGQVAGPPSGGGYDSPPSGDLQRLDELRRTFQPRRFGSGYDRGQVDRLFEEVMAGMAGHGPIPVSDADLDPRRFDLVPGGYFEGEVETALTELREILRRH